MNAHAHLTVADLSADQRAAYDAVLTWLNRDTAIKQTLSLAGYAGCLAGDTVVYYSRGSRNGNRQISLRDLYLKFNGFQVPGLRGIGNRWVDLTMPTFLESLWPDGKVERNRVVGVFESGVKPVIRIDFDNDSHLILTVDHPVATPGQEFVAAGELTVGDDVLARGSMKSGRGKGRRPIDARPPRVIVNTKYHPNGAYKAVECNGIVYEYMRVARARLVVEAAMNNISYEEFEHALKHNAGASAKFKYLPGGLKVDVHHLDEDTLNDDISNLEVLPHDEHARLHYAERDDLKKEFTRIVKVSCIRKMGSLMTYDVQMEPPANNFVANDIIVHNSGKSTVVAVLAHDLLRIGPIAFAAFTGKAASVLGRKLRASGIDTADRISRKMLLGPKPYCGTIHGLIYAPCDACMVEETYKHTMGTACRADGALGSKKTKKEPAKSKGEPELTVEAHCMRDPSVVGACAGSRMCTCECDVCVPPLSFSADVGPCLACDPPPPVKRDGPCQKCHGERFFRRSGLDRTYKLLIIDEASMVDDQMLRDLLSYRIPVLAVGDHGQLPPVRGQGSLMRAPDIRLEKIHRQAAGNPIIALSAHIRETGDVSEDFADGEHVQFMARRDFSKWIGARFPAERLNRDPMTPEGILGTVLISWTNKQRVALNDQVREALGISGESPKKGEAMICLKNAAPVYNGMRGVLRYDAVSAGSTEYPKWKTDVDFVEDDVKEENVLMAEAQFFAEKTIDYDAAQLLGIPMSRLGRQYDFGFALTCHKMQGSQAPEVAVLMDGLRGMDRATRTAWLYTSCTRAAERLCCIV